MNPMYLILMMLFSFSSGSKFGEGQLLDTGKQPEISPGANGIVRLVYGRSDSVFYRAIIVKNNFSSLPVFVAHVPGMHLGATRGPQLASSATVSMITAMDKKGSVHWFMVDNKTNKVKKTGIVNDQKGSAPEGLMGLASDDNDHFYAVWLDIRLHKQNNIFFSSFSTNEGKWSSNKLVYQSPEGHTCECCKPNIAVKGSHIAIMFRNWIKGSRDLYVAESFNNGKSFSEPKKLGSGTWKLNGCPMDGGSVIIDENNNVQTVWQRQGKIYYCRPGEAEQLIGNGRSCTISELNGRKIFSFLDGKQLKIKELSTNKEKIIGEGSNMKTVILPGNSLLCVWEKDNHIYFEKV